MATFAREELFSHFSDEFLGVGDGLATGGGVGGGIGRGGLDQDDEAAFMEAAIRESLGQAQPSNDDDDDPLLAEALKASMEEVQGVASSEIDDQFPNLRRQAHAESGGGGRGGGPIGSPGGVAIPPGVDAESIRMLQQVMCLTFMFSYPPLPPRPLFLWI